MKLWTCGELGVLSVFFVSQIYRSMTSWRGLSWSLGLPMWILWLATSQFHMVHSTVSYNSTGIDEQTFIAFATQVAASQAHPGAQKHMDTWPHVNISLVTQYVTGVRTTLVDIMDGDTTTILDDDQRETQCQVRSLQCARSWNAPDCHIHRGSRLATQG